MIFSIHPNLKLAKAALALFGIAFGSPIGASQSHEAPSAPHLDQSHWEKAYKRGQPGFWTIDGEPKTHLIKTVQGSNGRALETVLETHDQQTIEALDHKFHHVLGLYQEVMKHRKEFLEKVPAVTYQ